MMRCLAKCRTSEINVFIILSTHMHSLDQVDVKSITQRLFAFSKKNKFNIQVYNLAQAQALVAEVLGLSSEEGVYDETLEIEVDALVETARAGGYTVLREYDDKSKKLAYLEIVASGATRSIKKVVAVPHEELRNRLESIETFEAGRLSPTLAVYKDQRIALGHVHSRNPLRRREPVFGMGKRLIVSLGDAGLGHLQRAQNIISQAASAGWAVAAYDFLPEKEDFLGAMRRTVDSARRSPDMLVQANPLHDGLDFNMGSVTFIDSLLTKEDWHKVVFGTAPGMIHFAEMLSVIADFQRHCYPRISSQASWLKTYSNLDHVMSLLEEPKAAMYALLIKDALLNVLSVESSDKITLEQADLYVRTWSKWVNPFVEMACEHQEKSSKHNLAVQEVVYTRRISYAAVSLDESSKHDLYNRAYYQHLKHQAGMLGQAEAQTLVVLRVSGMGMQNAVVIEMTRVFSSKGYQVLLVIDGQTQKAAMIAQRLALAGRADCLWHICHIKESAAMPTNLSKATAGQCLFVNKEQMKEPMMLLPSA
jgi:hypothetical protein